MTVRARDRNTSSRLLVEILENRDVPSTLTGPSSSLSPALLPGAPGIDITSILTVGDSVGGYRMAGIPDGLGAYDNCDGTFTVLMNHEIGATSSGVPLGVVRDHGSAGAFVSKWVINKSDLSVVSGDDLIKQVYLWNSTTNSFEAATTAFNRFCSADLPDVTAFYNPATGKGTTARIFMNGEETSNGRAFAHVVTGPEAGTSWELSWTGKYAWENHVASPYAQDKTIVVGLDDSSRNYSSEGATQPSEVYFWVGNKQATGTAIEKAGLVHGLLYGMRVGTPGNYDANEGTVTSGERFELVGMTDQTNTTTFEPLQAESIAKTITQFRRVEDGAWDPNNPNDFYFVTTDQFTGNTRLWRLRFDDITNPNAGGTIEILVNGAAIGARMFDNIAVDDMGRVLLQEDPGNQPYLARVWAYDIATGGVLKIAEHDPAQFTPGAPGLITQDEESSGVIDVSDILGPGTYLMVDQIHASAGDPELVEKGQFLLMNIGATAGLGYSTKDGNVPAVVALGTDCGEVLTVDQSGTAFNVFVNGVSLNTIDGATKVLANGYGGADLINLCGVEADSTIVGGDGWDLLIGGSGSDAIYGGDGWDALYGNAGNDTLDGGDGWDLLDGGKGADRMTGGTGTDLFLFDTSDTLTDFGFRDIRRKVRN